jgi:hypothetical protein
MGLNSRGFVVSILVKPTSGEEACQPYATFPIFGTNSAICEALGVPLEIMCGWLMNEVKEDPKSQQTANHSKAETRVGRLLLASHKALLAKDYYRAEKLANAALQLDANCVAGHPLVYKMHLLSQVQDHSMKSMPTRPKVSKKLEAKDESASREDSERGGAEETLQPALPPLDPQVVVALDQVLTNSTEKTARNLVVVVDEQGGNEEQEEAPFKCAATARETELPLLEEMPAQAPLIVLAEDQEAAISRNDDGAASQGMEFFDGLLATLGGGLCIDVDSSRRDGMRGKCELQLGGLDLQFSWRDDTPHFQVIKLAPGSGSR